MASGAVPTDPGWRTAGEVRPHVPGGLLALPAGGLP